MAARVQRFARLFGSQAMPSSKSLLGDLRKKTGFPISKCKEALTQHDNDVEAAERALYMRAREEGWAKVEALSGRKACQGLVGCFVDGNRAAMLEVGWLEIFYYWGH